MLNKKWINWHVRLEDKIFNFLLECRLKHISRFRGALTKTKIERFPLGALLTKLTQ